MSAGNRPLSGLRVLSLAQQLPGPYCGLLLADLGAEVILIEQIPAGDPARVFPDLFEVANRAKKSVALDLKHPAGLEAFKRLAAKAQVVLEGFRPGVAGRLGIDFESVKAVRPDVIYCSISGYGQTGPARLVPGHDLSPYRSELMWAPARDGVRIPVTLAWHEGRVRRDGSAPLLVEGYGAYGESLEPLFGVQRLSLLERGFVIALAHVRGGGELGRGWYEAARGAGKQRSFDDFVDVTDHLVAERWAAPDKVFAHGASAGGLLLAAVANQAGARYRAMLLDMPFVDVLGAMLDPSLALTAPEWSQWGDPRERAGYAALAAWSPYDNVAARDYPALLVTAALWDTRVPYDGPVRWVARLRAHKTDRHPLLLHVEMNAGHDGEAGRLERPRQWARQYAFILDLACLAASSPAAAPAAAGAAGAEAAAVLPAGEVMRGGIKLTR